MCQAKYGVLARFTWVNKPDEVPALTGLTAGLEENPVPLLHSFSEFQALVIECSQSIWGSDEGRGRSLDSCPVTSLVIWGEFLLLPEF